MILSTALECDEFEINAAMMTPFYDFQNAWHATNCIITSEIAYEGIMNSN